MKNWTKLRDICLGGLLTVGVSILGYLASNIAELNKNVTIVIERQQWHYKAISENSDEIKLIKERMRGKHGR